MEIALCHPAPDAFRYAPLLGCRLGYLDISWAIIQPEPDVFDFSYYDPIVAEAAQSGLTLTAMVSSQRGIRYFPDGHWIWENSRGMMPDPAAWSRFLAVVVERYRQVIRFWEVWSEPNCLDCNPMSYYDPLLYREFLALASRTIRGADPTAKVVLGGIWLNHLLQDYVEALLAGGEALQYFDILSWHFFLLAGHRKHLSFAVWKDPLSRLMDFFRKQLPQDYPIWITEFGLPTTADPADLLHTSTLGEILGLTEEEQADWFSQFAEIAEREWDIGVLVWLMLADTETSAEAEHFSSNLGLLRADRTEKPVAARIAQLQARQRARRTGKEIAQGP